jgi:hypothetical protein
MKKGIGVEVWDRMASVCGGVDGGKSATGNLDEEKKKEGCEDWDGQYA